MKIELKKIEVSKALSEETTAFVADVWINDRKAFVASNRGHGGPIDFHPLDGAKGSNFLDLLRAATDYAETLPAVDFEGHELPMNLELLISEMVEDHLALKDLRRKLKAHCVACHDGKLWQWKLPKGRAMPDLIKLVRAQEPQAQILNELPEAEALKLWKEAA